MNLKGLPLVTLFNFAGAFVVFIIYLQWKDIYNGYTLVQVQVNIVDNSFCEVPSSGFRSWDNGMVTVLKPRIRKNCTKIFLGDIEEIKKVQSQSVVWRNGLSDGEFLKMIKNCSWVKDYFHENLYVTKTERLFPIAFSFVIYEKPQQVMRLLKVLYRPHNLYCIHPDLKSDKVFNDIFYNIAQCLDNVYISSKRENVVWGHYTLMEAQMNCLSDLVKLRSTLPNEKKWKYIINLCGKELPLSTNNEIVSHLKKLNGSSAIRAWEILPKEKKTWRRLRHKVVPFRLHLYKSTTYMGLSYDFAHYLLTNSTAIRVRNFFKGCYIPEEHFYPTMFMIPGVPGGHRPDINYFQIDQYLWKYNRHACSGRVVHSICIPTVKELKEIIAVSGDGQRALFHNKYFMELDHTIMDCMEERLVARNQLEFSDDCSKPIS